MRAVEVVGSVVESQGTIVVFVLVLQLKTSPEIVHSDSVVN